MKLRQKMILVVMRRLGGTATTRQISDELGISVNGVAQSLGSMENVKPVGGHGGDRNWELCEKPSNQRGLAL